MTEHFFDLVLIATSDPFLASKISALQDMLESLDQLLPFLLYRAVKKEPSLKTVWNGLKDRRQTEPFPSPVSSKMYRNTQQLVFTCRGATNPHDTQNPITLPEYLVLNTAVNANTIRFMYHFIRISGHTPIPLPFMIRAVCSAYGRPVHLTASLSYEASLRV